MSIVTRSIISKRERAQLARANALQLRPVVVRPGPWLLPSSWDRRVTLFEEARVIARAFPAVQTERRM